MATQEKEKINYIRPDWTDEEVEMFKQNIEMSKQEALDELDMLKDRLDDLNDHSSSDETMTYGMHMGDQGNEALEMEKTYAQVQRINDYMKKLEITLKSISGGLIQTMKPVSILHSPRSHLYWFRPRSRAAAHAFSTEREILRMSRFTPPPHAPADLPRAFRAGRSRGRRAPSAWTSRYLLACR